MHSDTEKAELLEAVEEMREQLLALIDKRTEDLKESITAGKEAGAAGPPAEAERTYPLSGDTRRFRRTRATKVTIGGEELPVKTWLGVYREILARCDAECHERLMGLRFRVAGRKRTILSDDPDRMHTPVKVCEGLYAEAHYDSGTLLDILKRMILSPAGYDYSGISITVIPNKRYSK